MNETKCKIALADTKEFVEALNSINSLITEVVFKFTDEGVNVTAMDPANVAMVNMIYKKDKITDYSCEGEQTHGVNLSQFLTSLKRAGDTATIEFANKITITGKGKKTKVFTVPALDIESKSDKIPPLNDFKADFKLKVSEFKDVIQDVAINGESCKFFTRDGKLMASSGDNNNQRTSNIDVITETADIREEVESRFSIEYLEKMFSKVAKEMTLQLGKDYPTRLCFEGESIRLTIILAPRVDND